MKSNRSLPTPAERLIIHASAVGINGEALVFLGPSGTGKSTISDLLSAQAQPLADDVVHLAPQAKGDRWTVSDANRANLVRAPSETGQAVTAGLPLHAIFRLRQAPATHLEQTDALEICRCLTDAFFEIHQQRSYDIETKKRAFNKLAAVARATAGYWLHFSLSDQTAQEISDALNSDLQSNP